MTSVLVLHIRANLSMMLALNYSSCHATRNTLSNVCSKQHAKTQMACKNSGFKSSQPLVGPIEAQPLQLNLRELMRVIHQMFAAIPQQYIHRHIDISEHTIPFCRCDTRWKYKVLKQI